MHGYSESTHACLLGWRGKMHVKFDEQVMRLYNVARDWLSHASCDAACVITRNCRTYRLLAAVRQRRCSRRVTHSEKYTLLFPVRKELFAHPFDDSHAAGTLLVCTQERFASDRGPPAGRSGKIRARWPGRAHKHVVVNYMNMGTSLWRIKCTALSDLVCS